MASTTGWQNSNVAGHVGNNQGNNNSSGFNAFPGAFRNVDGSFNNDNPVGHYAAFFWTSTSSSSLDGIYYLLVASNYQLYSSGNDKTEGYPVRLVRD